MTEIAVTLMVRLPRIIDPSAIPLIGKAFKPPFADLNITLTEYMKLIGLSMLR
jgi:hypothetical protein